MIVYSILGILMMVILAKLIGVSIKIFWKLLVNSIIGAVILFFFNFLGGIFGLHLALTAFNALIAGFLGLPGIILLLILNFAF